jgi:prepilin-type N-terminal cleavage/methylation domain-containing protein
MKIQQNKKGFTIIEVVLVLAIAGLIFLMVFIALPALQRSQRDTQRKNDLSRIVTQLTSYSSNNRGQIPASLITTSGVPLQSFVQRYLKGASTTVAGTDYQDPQAGTYTFMAANAAIPTTPVIGNIYYNTSVTCGTDGATQAGTARQFTIRMFLESQQSPYCVDNH